MGERQVRTEDGAEVAGAHQAGGPVPLADGAEAGQAVGPVRSGGGEGPPPPGVVESRRHAVGAPLHPVWLRAGRLAAASVAATVDEEAAEARRPVHAAAVLPPLGIAGGPGVEQDGGALTDRPVVAAHPGAGHRRHSTGGGVTSRRSPRSEPGGSWRRAGAAARAGAGSLSMARMPPSLPEAATASDLPTLADLEHARARIAGRVHRTPLLTARSLDEAAGARLLLKAESLQRGGAFKARGAFNAVLAGLERGDRRPLAAVSSGNHGQAVALAARDLGLQATVVMPEDAAPLKIAATRAYGAEVVCAGVDSRNREAVARELAERRGLRMIHPFDDPDVIAGQGTCALELLEQAAAAAAHLDAVLVPVGGGGLIAGVATAIRARSPRTLVVGVEPETADDAARSLAAGRRLALDGPPATIADGVRTLQVGERPWAVIRERVDAIVTVDEAAIGRACWWLWTRAKLVVEPTAALPLAALLEGRLPIGAATGAGGAPPHRPPALPPDPTVALVLSGGNVDPRALAAVFGTDPERR